MCWNAKYAALLLYSTAITYSSGLLIDWCDRKEKPERVKKAFVALSFTLNLSLLFLFKYFRFAVENLNFILAKCGIEIITPEFDLLLPVGISFYIFQALSYTMDVYRKEIYVERNFLKYALFVSFFPQLVAGPIERSKNLLKQINKEHKFSYENFRSGLLISGMWHGAQWTYVAWGGLNGIFQVAGNMLMPLRRNVSKLLGVRENSFGNRLLKMLATFALVDLTWIFFRANSMRDALHIIKSIFTVHNSWIFTDGSIYGLGLNARQLELAQLDNVDYISREEAQKRIGAEIKGEYAVIVENGSGETVDTAVFKKGERIS